MSRIDELIAEHCPDGVHYPRLSEVARIRNGKDYKHLQEGAIPVYGSGGIMTYVAAAAYDKPSVLIPRKGSLSKLYYVDEPFWTVDTIFYTEVSDLISPKFFYYYLLTQRLEELNQAGGVPSLTQSVLNELRIPLPPMPVQQEIVRILDAMTTLQAELQAELAARRSQYEFYRESLLSFNDAGTPPWRWVAMGEIAEVRSGWGFPLSEQGLTTGDVPFYKVSDMNLLGNEVIMNQANHYISKSSVSRLGIKPAPAGTIIFPKIGAAVATNKKRVLSVESAYDNNVMGLIPGPQVLSRYLYHWMQTFNLSELANDSGAMPSIRKSEAEELLVPVPSLDDQLRISSKLDAFDVLVNDLSVGLPAEIKARRQQYEYYRDQLLSFKELAA